MQELESILVMIDNEESLPLIRKNILKLIRERLIALESKDDTWALSNFRDALSSFERNIQRNLDNTNAPYIWMKDCLSAIERACVPIDGRSEKYVEPSEKDRAIKYEDVLSKVEALLRREL